MDDLQDSTKMGRTPQASLRPSSRPAKALSVMAWEFVLPFTLLVTVIIPVWMLLWKPLGGSLAGTSRVHIIEGDLVGVVRQKQIKALVNPTSNALKRPSTSESVSFQVAESISAALQNGFWKWDGNIPENLRLKELKPGKFRVRLGDVVYGGEFSSMRIFHAAIYDERFLIDDSRRPPQPAASADWSLAGLAYAGEAPAQQKIPQETSVPSQEQVPPKKKVTPFLQEELKLKVQEKRVPQLDPKLGRTPQVDPKLGRTPQVEPKTGRTPQTKTPPSRRPPPSSPTRKAPKKPIRGRRTTDEIVTSATMVALLQAESRGIQSIAFPPLGSLADGLSPLESVQAIAAGITIVATHLSSINDIFLVIPKPSPSQEDIDKIVRESIPQSYSGTVWNLLSTPLSLPARGKLLSVDTIPKTNPRAGDPELFNVASAASVGSTAIPTLAFLTIAALVFGLRLWTLPVEKLRPSLRGFVGGVASLLVLLTLLLFMGSLWRWPPEWLGTTPVLLFAAIATGVPTGWMLSWIRTKAILEQPTEAGRDNILRSVLHRDTPIEDIAQDRLGFGPLVMALYRFLDNPDTEPPIVISVNGPWGSGKSSIMKMLASELSKTGRFRTVWFNAWRYHKEEQILAAFLQTIARQLSEGWGLRFALRLGWERFKGQTFFQYLGLLIPITLVGIALVYPEHVLLSVLSKARGIAEQFGGQMGTAVLVLGGASGLGVGGVSLLQLLFPFRLRFKKLYAVRDQGQRIGFIDEFTREFKLYRQAVGYQKFLIVIDDLDRCPPDKVVDVLKTINLIVTSGDGAGRSFFLLGFDPKYIVKSIELHFKDFAKSGEAIDHQFAPEYLKKMVTISVSVPMATTDGVRRLLDGIDQVRTRQSLPGDQLRWSEKLRARLRWPPVWVSQLVLAVATVAMLVLLGVSWVPRDEPSAPPAIFSPRKSTTADVSGKTKVIKIPEFVPPEPHSIRWWYWIPTGLLLLGCAALCYRISSSIQVEEVYRREPQDSERFKTAVNQSKNMLPENPRDIVRLINLMRMEHLIQESTTAPFSGRPLDEWESVSFTVLQQRHPKFFDQATIENEIIPAISSRKDELNVEQLYNGLGRDFASIAADIQQLAGAGGKVTHLADPEKLRRYADINRFVIDVSAERQGGPRDKREKRASSGEFKHVDPDGG